jgi:hypothetical protein
VAYICANNFMNIPSNMLLDWLEKFQLQVEVHFIEVEWRNFRTSDRREVTCS